MRSARLTVIIALLACAGLTAPQSATGAGGSHASAAQAQGGEFAERRLTRARGGRVRTPGGIELRVPKRVMRRAGIVSVRQLGPSRFDFHIAAPWKGTVTVTLPIAGGVPGIAHRTRRGWRIERARISNGKARIRVRSLSVFDTDEQFRYAVETMNLSYTAFLARKADFKNHGCKDAESAKNCDKPSPYDEFNWTDDGCSPEWMPGFLYPDLFDGPCQQHDFGYRNFGRGPQLGQGRDEDTRAWIDARFAQEMGRLCTDKFSHPLQTANEVKCKSDAGYVVGVVRHAGHGSFWAPFYPGRPAEPADASPSAGTCLGATSPTATATATATGATEPADPPRHRR